MTSSQAGKRHEPRIPPPALLDRWQMWAILAALLLIPFFLPIPRSLRYNPLTSHFGDRLHIPLLGAIYLLIYWKGPLRGRLWLGAVAAAAVGGAIELLQTLVGRGALLHDWYLDLQGIGLVLFYVLWRGHGRRLGLAALVLLLVAIPLQSHRIPGLILASYECKERFPFLEDFESPVTEILWKDQYSAALSFGAPSGTGPNHTLRIHCPAGSSWPGASMHNFPGDWRNSRYLVFSARNRTAGMDSLAFAVRLDDWEGRLDAKWLSQRFVATPDWQTFRLDFTGRPVWQGDRLFDPSDVVSLLFFLHEPSRDMILEIDDIHLQ